MTTMRSTSPRTGMPAGRALSVVLVAVALVAVACGGDNSSSHGTTTITMVSHDSFNATDAVLAQFTQQTGIKVEIAKGNDAGEVLNKAILTKGHPEGDLLWGVDNTLLSRAIDENVFVPYAAPGLSSVDPAVVALAPGHQLTPVDQGDVCVNYDIAYYQKKGVPPPQTLDDLRQPEYKGQLVTENPGTSSPGLVFLLATIARYGPDGWQQYWKDLRANGLEAVDGWTQAYTQEFSGSSGKGPKPLVVSYASSPPAEVVGATEPKPTTAPTGVLVDSCFRQYEFVGVLRGTKHEAEARQFIEFLLSKSFQEDMPLQMYVYPVNRQAALPEEFVKYTPPVPHPLALDPADIAAHRDGWIDQWTNLVLR